MKKKKASHLIMGTAMKKNPIATLFSKAFEHTERLIKEIFQNYDKFFPRSDKVLLIIVFLTCTYDCSENSFINK